MKEYTFISFFPNSLLSYLLYLSILIFLFPLELEYLYLCIDKKPFFYKQILFIISQVLCIVQIFYVILY